MALLLTACGGAAGEDKSVADQEEKAGVPQETVQEAAPYPITLTDDSGKQVTIEREPKKIVSILPSVTEIAFALGLEQQIVAVTENDDYPEAVKNKETVGGMELNFEKITALEPDLVLAGNLNGEAVQKLRDLGLTVLVVEGNDLEGTYASIELVGKATNREQAAKKIVSEMKADVRKVQQLVQGIPESDRVHVWLEVSPDMYTPGAGTLQDELITLAGGQNIAADGLEGWGQLSEEKVVERNPDVIVGTYDAVEQTVVDRKGWADLEAVKNGRVYFVHPDLLSRPGPRLTEGLRQLVERFYPDAGANDKAA